MLILADLGHDPKHWPSEAATAADKLGVSGGAEPRQERFSCETHWWLGTTLTRICHMFRLNNVSVMLRLCSCMLIFLAKDVS